MHGDARQRVSRRSAISNGLTYAAAVTAILIAKVIPAYAGKMGQKSVSYQETPKGSSKCSNCSLFEPPHACKSVAGVINPDGWCSIYRKA